MFALYAAIRCAINPGNTEMPSKNRQTVFNWERNASFIILHYFRGKNQLFLDIEIENNLINFVA